MLIWASVRDCLPHRMSVCHINVVVKLDIVTSQLCRPEQVAYPPWGLVSKPVILGLIDQPFEDVGWIQHLSITRTKHMLMVFGLWSFLTSGPTVFTTWCPFHVPNFYPDAQYPLSSLPYGSNLPWCGKKTLSHPPFPTTLLCSRSWWTGALS